MCVTSLEEGGHERDTSRHKHWVWILLRYRHGGDVLHLSLDSHGHDEVRES